MDNRGKDKPTEIQKEIEEAYLKHRTELMIFIRASVPNVSMVEDIAHDVFLEALKNKDTFINHPKQIGWLYNTARYKIKEYMRKLQAVDTFDIDDESIEIGECDSGYLQAELEQYVKETLTKEERKCYHRYFFWGYSVEEIAQMEGTTVNNIRVRLSRLKKKLLQQIKNLV